MDPSQRLKTTRRHADRTAGLFNTGIADMLGVNYFSVYRLSSVVNSKCAGLCAASCWCRRAELLKLLATE